jgi:hypothetical protein
MANKGRLSFMKKQKERARKEKAAEKMARRQGKIERPVAEGQWVLAPPTDVTGA